jgi:hypothetical protein
MGVSHGIEHTFLEVSVDEGLWLTDEPLEAEGALEGEAPAAAPVCGGFWTPKNADSVDCLLIVP